MKEIVKNFSISDIDFVDTENSSDFFYAEIWLIGAKNNSHRNPITEEVLMKYGDTALGKWIVSDIRNGEATSHTETQKIIGVIPSDSEIKYKRNKDGELFIVADAVLSKIYNVDAWTMFNEHNHREVSCEFLAKEGEPLENGDIPIEAFDIKGVTILGSYKNGIHASCKGAEMFVTKFSEEDAEKYYKSFDKSKSLKEFAEKRKEELSINKKVKQKKLELYKEEEMAEEKKLSESVDDKEKNENIVMEEDKEIVELAETPEEKDDKSDEVEKKDENKDDEVEKEMGCHEANVLAEAEEEKKEKEEPKKFSLDAYADTGAILAMLESETEKYVELAKKVMAEFSAEDIVSKFVAMAKENDELKEFKEDIEKKETDKKFASIMASVKGDLDAESFKKFAEEGKELKLNELGAFENKVNAFAYKLTKGMANKESNTEILLMGMPREETNNNLTADDIFKKYL